MARESASDPALGRDGVEIAGVAEADLVTVDGGEAKEAGLVLHQGLGLGFVGGGVKGDRGEDGEGEEQMPHECALLEGWWEV